MPKTKPRSVPIVKPVDIDGVMVNPLTVSRAQAAALLSVDVQTVDRAIAAKTLKAKKLGDRVLVNYASILAVVS